MSQFNLSTSENKFWNAPAREFSSLCLKFFLKKVQSQKKNQKTNKKTALDQKERKEVQSWLNTRAHDRSMQGAPHSQIQNPPWKAGTLLPTFTTVEGLEADVELTALATTDRGEKINFKN